MADAEHGGFRSRTTIRYYLCRCPPSHRRVGATSFRGYSIAPLCKISMTYLGTIKTVC